jgi:hypothetical protein
MPIGKGGVLTTIHQRCAAVSAAIARLFRRNRSEFAEGQAQAESGEVETEAAVAEMPAAADSNRVQGHEIEAIVHHVVDQQEIERRRNLVRIFFNDFWGGVLDKPAAFVERLDQAEDYLNERLAANGELWRVDAGTRRTLGLPSRASAAGSAKQTS